MDTRNDIFEYVTTEENRFSLPIPVIDGWDWSFKDHVKVSTLYKNFQLETGKKKGTPDEKPVKNIVRPILNLRYRAEDIDVKDIVIYVDNEADYHLSFLVKKYHDDVFVVENDLDTFFDEVKESKIDFGGGLVKDVGEAKPDVIPLQSIAFCDQTDLLSGPIGIKWYYSPDQLKEMEEKGWGDAKNGATMTIDELITIAEEKKENQSDKDVITPGKYIEVYEVHGNLPERYYDDNAKDNKYSRQFHMIAYYRDSGGKKQGVTLFKSREDETPFKLVQDEKIYGRALGLGGVEELFEPQIWTNYGMIRKKDMLDSASKTLLKTTDPAIMAKHPSGLKNLGNLEFVEIEEGKDVGVLDTYPRNIDLFDKSVAEWEEHAQRVGGATEALMGETPPSGTPFRLNERVVAEGKGLHEYRLGKYAKWIEELYRDLFIPYMQKQIVNGAKFLSTLSLEELQTVADKVAKNEANKYAVEKVLNGEIFDKEEVARVEAKSRERFMAQGDKRFIEILKNEFKNKPFKVKINVKGKQKDLNLRTDKLTNILRYVMSTFNPQTGTFAVFEDPRMAGLFNQVLESSDLSPIDYGAGRLKDTQPQPNGQPNQLQSNPEQGGELSLTESITG